VLSTLSEENRNADAKAFAALIAALSRGGHQHRRHHGPGGKRVGWRPTRATRSPLGELHLRQAVARTTDRLIQKNKENLQARIRKVGKPRAPRLPGTWKRFSAKGPKNRRNLHGGGT